MKTQKYNSIKTILFILIIFLSSDLFSQIRYHVTSKTTFVWNFTKNEFVFQKKVEQKETFTFHDSYQLFKQDFIPNKIWLILDFKNSKSTNEISFVGITEYQENCIGNITNDTKEICLTHINKGIKIKEIYRIYKIEKGDFELISY
jgi:hypothetical protein